MSIATVICRAQLGLHAPLVQVEVSLDSGLPGFSIVGLPATVVKESKKRVRTAREWRRFSVPPLLREPLVRLRLARSELCFELLRAGKRPFEFSGQ